MLHSDPLAKLERGDEVMLHGAPLTRPEREGDEGLVYSLVQTVSIRNCRMYELHTDR